MFRAKIAVSDNPITNISSQGSVGTGYYASPATNALLWVNANYSSYRVLLHSAGETGIYTPGLIAMAALHGEGDVLLSLHTDPR